MLLIVGKIDAKDIVVMRLLARTITTELDNDVSKLLQLSNLLGNLILVIASVDDYRVLRVRPEASQEAKDIAP